MTTWKPTHRHVKNGELYQLLNTVVMMEKTWTLGVLYVNKDGLAIARDMSEFLDGRFERIEETSDE